MNNKPKRFHIDLVPEQAQGLSVDKQKKMVVQVLLAIVVILVPFFAFTFGYISEITFAILFFSNLIIQYLINRKNLGDDREEVLKKHEENYRKNMVPAKAKGVVWGCIPLFIMNVFWLHHALLEKEYSYILGIILQMILYGNMVFYIIKNNYFINNKNYIDLSFVLKEKNEDPITMENIFSTPEYLDNSGAIYDYNKLSEVAKEHWKSIYFKLAFIAIMPIVLHITTGGIVFRIFPKSCYVIITLISCILAFYAIRCSKKKKLYYQLISHSNYKVVKAICIGVDSISVRGKIYTFMLYDKMTAKFNLYANSSKNYILDVKAGDVVDVLQYFKRYYVVCPVKRRQPNKINRVREGGDIV